MHFEKLEFAAEIFQVPAAVKVPEITSPGTLTRAAAAVAAWYAASDDRARWECSRVVVPDIEYKTGQPLDTAADKIVWGETNETQDCGWGSEVLRPVLRIRWASNCR